MDSVVSAVARWKRDGRWVCENRGLAPGESMTIASDTMALNKGWRRSLALIVRLDIVHVSIFEFVRIFNADISFIIRIVKFA